MHCGNYTYWCSKHPVASSKNGFQAARPPFLESFTSPLVPSVPQRGQKTRNVSCPSHESTHFSKKPTSSVGRDTSRLGPGCLVCALTWTWLCPGKQWARPVCARAQTYVYTLISHLWCPILIQNSMLPPHCFCFTSGSPLLNENPDTRAHEWQELLTSSCPTPCDSFM